VEHQRFAVTGLRDEVAIKVDRWGIPHIYATCRDDVFLAQGFNAARDRLFQIDLWRRRGHGLLSEVFGPGYVEQDRANRLLLYRGDMEAEWAAYGPGVRPAVEQFTAGINAYIAWALEEPGRLPPEFGLYGYEPARWEPSDAVRFRTHGLLYNVEQEVARARTVRLAGTAVDELRQAREPHDRLVVPEGLDLGDITDEVLATYRLAFAPVDFGGVAAGLPADTSGGSNNWVVDGSRTATGRPILANDPHRAVTLPGLRYVAHLNAPDLNVIGAGEPGLPGISIGHNDHVGFGLTIWPADVEDLYVYRLDPSDPSRYLGPGGWAEFRSESEQIAVKGAAPERVELLFTVHGPVIHRDVSSGVAVALRAAWLEPGMAPYLASIGYDDARDGDAFLAALERWGTPAVNQVFATVGGDWGWQVAARIPRRAGWDGSLPVPGDGRYEWAGFAGSSSLPAERRPERGWVATANQENLPEGWDNRELTTTYDWYTSGRAIRLQQWLSEDGCVSVERSASMQWDCRNIHAVQLMSRLAATTLPASPLADEFVRLCHWDGFERADSREALVFQIWVRRHLRPRLVTERLRADGLDGDDLAEARSLLLKDESGGGDLRGDLALASWLTSEIDEAARVFIIEETLAGALAEIESLLGPESAQPWSWGRLHHSALTHAALAPYAGRVDPAWVRLGPRPRDGSGDTVGNVSYDARFCQTLGSSFRMVLDVGEWDRSVVVNSPGQSADPRSPHYADLFDAWARGETFPLAFSPEAVDEVTTMIIHLEPGR